MPAEASEPNFFDYLKCDLPEGYPLIPPITLPLQGPLRDVQRKDLLQRETQLVGLAEQVAPTHPWLAYIAAVKHDIFIGLIPASDVNYVDINQAKIFSDSQQRWRVLRRSTRAAIDDPTAHFCERLADLQRNALKVALAEKQLAAAVAAGFPVLEPMPPKPPEIEESFLAGLLGLNKKQITEQEAALKVWHKQDSYQQICEKAVNLIKTLPQETRRTALTNLPATLAALADLRDERAALENTYITPFAG